MVRSVGIEEEFLLLDLRDAKLAPKGGPVAENADHRSDGQFEHEFKREQAELGTDPHEDLAALKVELRRRRAELARSAAVHGSRILALGTAPVDAAATTTGAKRYQAMTEIFGETARAALSCGMHVHVDIDSRDEGVRVLNGIRGWLPVVLALSANSPFLAGRDTAYQSYRSVLWQRWPTAGPSGTFADADDYDRTRAALVASGAALDDGMLYFDARLSATYPTLEFRVADVCARIEDAIVLAGLCRALVDRCAAGRLPAPDPLAARVELVRAAAWRAARYGMEERLLHPVDGQLVPAWDLVDELVEMLRPSLGDLEFDGLAAIRSRGTGSRLQRQVYEATGDLEDVVDALADTTLR